MRSAQQVLAGKRLSFLALTVLCGFLAGSLEVSAKFACRLAGGSSRLFEMTKHFVWLIPIVNAGLFLMAGLVPALVLRLVPRWDGPRIRAFVIGMALLPACLVLNPTGYALCWLMFCLGIAWQATKWFEAHPVARRRAFWAIAPLVLLAPAVGFGWTLGTDWLAKAREDAAPKPSKRAPNVLLIVLDTVRADHLSLYGYHRKTTPNLERMADWGVRFDAARSTSSWTLPAHASLFTGKLPSEVQARWLEPIGKESPTLAGYLSAKGYATAGFIANTFYCSYDSGLARGFTHYEDYPLDQADALLTAKLAQKLLDAFFLVDSLVSRVAPPGALHPFERFVADYVYSGERKTAAAVNRGFLGWLDGRRDQARPFFAFLNYIDAHDPYLPPAGAQHRFGSPPAQSLDFDILQNWNRVDKGALDARYARLASDAYDNCLGYLDDRLRELSVELSERGLLDNTLVIVTSDHGEELGEHDLFLHGESLYREEIRVPFVVVPPGSEKVRRPVVPETVSMADLPATVVDVAGAAKGSPFPGRSLAPLWRNRSGQGEPTIAISELEAPNAADPTQERRRHPGPLLSVALGPWVYIRSGDREELYNDATDPGELRNLSAEPSAQGELERFRRFVNRGKAAPALYRRPAALPEVARDRVSD